jgi:hypothetical protein
VNLTCFIEFFYSFEELGYFIRASQLIILNDWNLVDCGEILILVGIILLFIKD